MHPRPAVTPRFCGMVTQLVFALMFVTGNSGYAQSIEDVHVSENTRAYLLFGPENCEALILLTGCPGWNMLKGGVDNFDNYGIRIHQESNGDLAWEIRYETGKQVRIAIGTEANYDPSSEKSLDFGFDLDEHNTVVITGLNQGPEGCDEGLAVHFFRNDEIGSYTDGIQELLASDPRLSKFVTD